MAGKDMHGLTWLVIFILIVAFIFFLIMRNKSESYRPFNNSEYQYGNPNVEREYNYYKCISDECGGNTHDYPCLEKCHLKAYRRGMAENDIQSMVCQAYASSNEDEYYKCLDQVYTRYRYP